MRTPTSRSCSDGGWRRGLSPGSGSPEHGSLAEEIAEKAADFRSDPILATRSGRDTQIGRWDPAQFAGSRSA
jgi:hypothetical protein